MGRTKKSFDKLIVSLEERVRELNCLYEIEEILSDNGYTVDEALAQIVDIIPIGWQFPDICRAKVTHRDNVYLSRDFRESPWMLHVDITVQERKAGSIRVYYLEEKPPLDKGPFLNEEVRLLNTISVRLGHYIMYQKLKLVFNKWESTKQDMSQRKSGEWEVILELLRRTDPDLYIRISRKMLNYMVWKGIGESEYLLQKFNPSARYEQTDVIGEANSPLRKRSFETGEKVAREVFKMAQNYLSSTEILSNIQKWIQQDKTAFLVRATSNNDTSLTDIADAVRKYFQIAPEGLQLMPSILIGVRAALIRRFFTEQLEFINIAKNYVRISDFNELIRKMIFPTGSHGKLGGKSAGLFLASRIINNVITDEETREMIRVPKTWFITSDTLIHFMHYNNLEEILEQKYKDVDEVRKEYPHVVQLFKNSHFPPEIVQGLSMALDNFGEIPIIVRSSSLLEDRLGSAFSGKYKSLFLANQGSKQERLEALMDAIAEVYASTIGPDPIEYRAERGLLDFHEEMGIMLQEVVGTRVGDYFLPSFAGVAFSNNEFRWSPRIRREDGLIRIVPGLGTRAVDRLSDDYPILIAPGQPNLKANVSINEIIRYAPQKADAINLRTKEFETIDIRELMQEHGNDYPGINRVISIFEHNNVRKPVGVNLDYTKADLIVTFDGLVKDTNFVSLIHRILKELQAALATPVDIEFASDGKYLYLLQCRPQSYSKFDAPSPIPEDIPEDRLLFSANRYVSNGTVPEITHIVYVTPDSYNALHEKKDMEAVGKAVGKLNKVLPKRKFILMGPGRWGSRGDIKLGVSVTYSDINNTCVLVEIARKKGNYVPDLSFGTHFFQDLVEAGIRYLPLYPDDSHQVFKEEVLLNAPNQLVEFLPEYRFLEDVVKVVDINSIKPGNCLRILMNADAEKAVGIFTPRDGSDLPISLLQVHGSTVMDHTRWREDMAEKIALQLDPRRFGVREMFLAGSVRSKSAQAGSDVDLVIRFKGSEEQKKALISWMEGWSLCLDEMNFQKTGYKAGGLLHLHFYDELPDNFLSMDGSHLKKLQMAVPSSDY